MRNHTGSLVVSLLACAAMTVTSAPVAAQDGPRAFTRAGQWQLDAADEECRIARAYTNGADQIALALERNRADPVVRLVLVSNAITTFRSTQELGYRFLPSGEQRSARYIHADMDGGQRYFNLGNVLLGTPSPPAADGSIPLYDRAAELAFAEGITAIDINEGLTSPVRLETGSLRAAIAALQVCTDDLLRTWGLDWERHQNLSRRAMPEGNSAEWVFSLLDPFADAPNFSAGRNSFRVMISAEGQPTSCVPQWASLDDSKNERICNAFMERGRFQPALDAAGQPIASYWIAELQFFFGAPPSR